LTSKHREETKCRQQQPRFRRKTLAWWPRPRLASWVLFSRSPSFERSTLCKCLWQWFPIFFDAFLALLILELSIALL